MTVGKCGRRNGPFVIVSCAALPAQMLETELFGYEKGQHKDHRCNKAKSSNPGRSKTFPGRSILSTQYCPHQHPASSGQAGGYSAPCRTFPRQFLFRF